MRGRSLNGNSQKDLDEDQTLFDVRFWRAYAASRSVSVLLVVIIVIFF
jgi:hypothetical protein